MSKRWVGMVQPGQVSVPAVLLVKVSEMVPIGAPGIGRPLNAPVSVWPPLKVMSGPEYCAGDVIGPIDETQVDSPLAAYRNPAMKNCEPWTSMTNPRPDSAGFHQ